ncbi:hypothetical protein CJ263_04355 [Maribacter cobaltidurans]|uniref:Uncharacterized protein n=2 Tax=Maribacter cobaltidurans TaxID=1178778 RepID=A0A223V297_9FLAO|nr:hypothetical protein CJ263_04355 [Maribacter cobaltidurans]
MYNVSDEEVIVLGRCTATASTDFSILIDRSGIEERPLEEKPPFRIETGLGQVVVTFPCVEGRYRTSLTPMGWRD